MNPQLLLVIVIRWIHIICATLAIGGPFFLRFVLLPAAAKVLDEPAHQQLRSAINARWKHIVYTLITLFILTGLFQFLVPIRVDGVLLTARWKDFSPAQRQIYHMVFGIKMIAAFSLFFLASVLPGRTQTFAPLRKNVKAALLILLLLAAVVIACSNVLRYLPRPSASGAPLAPAAVLKP